MDRDEQKGAGANRTAPTSPQVVVMFDHFKPPFDAASTVKRLLGTVPSKYLTGLGAVVITNSRALSRERRNSATKARRRKVRIANAAGLYHPPVSGNPAWIEIFVDNALRGWEKSLWLRIPLIRESKLSDVLFHEIGHHIGLTVHPEYREKEDVADVWKVRLQRSYHRQRFGWIRRFALLFQPLSGKFLDRQREKLQLEMLKKGQISRAEYQELTAKKRTLRKPLREAGPDDSAD